MAPTGIKTKTKRQPFPYIHSVSWSALAEAAVSFVLLPLLTGCAETR